LVRGVTARYTFFTTRTVGCSFDDTVTHQRHTDRVARQTAARRATGCARDAAMRFAIAMSAARVGLTFVYGVVLGELCRRSGGLMAPFITHVFTDLVIVT
jgi:hypothetical protein